MGFSFVIFFKKSKTKLTPFKIISIGNLTVGGTGKSVVTPFLLNILGRENSAIIMRGYGGSVAKGAASKLVTDGVSIYTTKEECGDEAMMYALDQRVPVFVGKNRAQSCLLLQSLAPLWRRSGKNISHVLLDDAYQNFDVKKDFEILLLDARSPFDNGHCLQRGRLREKDYMRADVIIITHADAITKNQQLSVINALEHFPKEKIFMGSHSPAGVFFQNITQINKTSLEQIKFLLVAGVGSFSGVYSTACKAGLNIGYQKQLQDHHVYSLHDVHEVLDEMRLARCQAILTTSKDWVKLEPLVKAYRQNSPFYVIRVQFEFLLLGDYDNFTHLLRKHVL